MVERKLEIESGSDSELEIFPTWNFRDSSLPARSSLFSLPPINVGTSEVESLTSYISRLSFEYRISPTSLLKYGLSENITLPVNIADSKIIYLTKSINGMEVITDALVKALQKATMRDDLYFTTLLAWKDKISDKNLFHSHKFWCPLCFYEQKNEFRFNYEKLIWALKPATKCLKHQIILENKCSNCNRLLSVFSSSTRPGCCSNCFKWLGKRSVSPKGKKFSSFDDENLNNTLFEKIIESSTLAKISPGTSQFAHNLSNIIKQTASGDIKAFSHRVKIWHQNIRFMLKDKMLPTWEVLSNISKNTGVQISDLLLTAQLEISNKNVEYVQSLSQIKSNISDLADIINPGDKNLKNILEISIFEYPPPSITEITRRVGFYSLERLNRNHPSLYKRIVEKHKNYIETNRKILSEKEIEEVLVNACTENPPPSLKSIFRGINCLNIAYRFFDKHPTLCLIIAIRHKNVRVQIPELIRIEKKFTKALNEQLTPLTSDFPMIKFPRRILNRHFSELSEILINKRNDKLKTPSKKVREFSKHIENLYYSKRNRD